MAKRNNSIPVPRIIVAKPEGFTNEARGRFELGLGRKRLGFRNEDLTGNYKAASLSGDGALNLPDSTVVIPLSNISSRSFFFGATLTFEPHALQYALKSISLRVFEGLAQDERELILRAEWDEPETHGKFQHAQPHWHAYPSLSQTPAPHLAFSAPSVTVPTDLPDEIEEGEALDGVGQPTSKPVERITKFHLAMAMSWHRASESCQISLSEKSEVLAWIQYCSSYIVQQLSYLSD